MLIGYNSFKKYKIEAKILKLLMAYTCIFMKISADNQVLKPDLHIKGIEIFTFQTDALHTYDISFCNFHSYII